MKPILLALAISLGTSVARGQAVTAGTPAAAQAIDVSDLPLTELPAAKPAGVVAVFLTGDGGWATLDRQVGEELARHGVSVVAMNSRSYLGGEGKTPDRVAADVARLARAYLARWNASRLVLVGYSRGADLMPFVASRLPADLRARTAAVAMLGLASGANFHFHLGDIFHDVKRRDDIPVAPELAKLRPLYPAGMRFLCMYGTDEQDSGCRGAESVGITPYPRAGGHHFDGDAAPIGAIIAAAIPAATR